MCRRFVAGGGGLLREAEIEEFDALFRGQDVGRFKVVVDDAFAGGGIENVENLGGVFDRFFNRQRAMEGHAFD